MWLYYKLADKTGGRVFLIPGRYHIKGSDGKWKWDHDQPWQLAWKFRNTITLGFCKGHEKVMDDTSRCPKALSREECEDQGNCYDSVYKVRFKN